MPQDKKLFDEMLRQANWQPSDAMKLFIRNTGSGSKSLAEGSGSSTACISSTCLAGSMRWPATA